jgi:hypothetical protein
MKEIQGKAWIFSVVCGEPAVVILGLQVSARRSWIVETSSLGSVVTRA